ncbi:hypothetical protein NDU88_005916 [Pleurodeles waltl]|uniref:Basic proline-rich protein-like n=1 Tax=Pleurodeles waltl TaxID=8319 RepID=A0AAV7TXZ1_PLEWA|nr:hypothetical protein NDU88_005916 [Pleurodeles waltl]
MSRPRARKSPMSPPGRSSTSNQTALRFAPVTHRRVAPTLSLGLAPSPILSVSRNSTTGRVYSWAIGPQPATPPQRGDSSGVPRCPRADRPRAASVRSPARGHNPDRGPAPVFSWGRPPSGALPLRTPTGRNHSRAPSGTSAAAGGLVRGPPPPRSVRPHAASDRGPNRQPSRRGGDSTGVPCCPRADCPRAASVRSPARGHDLDRGPAPVFSWGRPPPGALPRCTPTGRNHSRALGPLPALPQPRGGRLVRSPPPPRSVCPHAASDRGLTRGPGLGRVSRPPAPELTSGPISPPSTLRGRRVGPHSLGHFLRLSPSARTSTGPEKARFRTFSRRPIWSEKFRRAPSPGPWPRL